MTVTSGDVLVETFPSFAPLAYRPIFSQEPSGVQHRTLRIAVGRTTEAYQYAKLGFRRLRQAYDVTSQRCNCPPYLSLSQRARCRQQIAASVKEQYASFGRWLAPHQLPIVYNDVYNVSFMGIENLHVFDSKKFRKVVASLERDRLLKHNQLVSPTEATDTTLLDVHTQNYIDDVKTHKTKVAQVTELPILVLLPNWVLQWRVVKPMRYMVNGTILAAGIAMERGWSINIGGGMHHAHHDNGAGWCMFSDLTLALRQLRKASQGAVQNIMIIDTDVHQGNGYERDKLHFRDSDLYILDVYNVHLWPKDTKASTAINTEVALSDGTEDAEYLGKLREALETAFASFQPDIVLYNAGTDVLVGDPLGRMSVTMEGIVKRDAIVFQKAQQCMVPITMVLSGGYAADSHKAVAASIANLIRTFNLA